MRNPSLAFLAAAFLAASASAQTATPGTASPHSSGDWGTAGTEGVSKKAKAIMAKLLAKAKDELVFTVVYNRGKAGEKTATLKSAYGKTPDFEVDLNNIVIGGSPAAAFSAGIGMNAPGRKFNGVDHSGNDLIYSTQALYEMGDQNHAAVFLAHELGHLALGHAKKLDDKKKALIGPLYDEWAVRNTVPDDEPTDVTTKRFFKDMAPKLQELLAKEQAPMEEEADAYGRALAQKAEFPDTSGEAGFQRAQDWLWAHKLEMSDPNHGGSVADRAKESAKWAADQQAAKERAAAASRRAKCATEGTSCQ
ncbi:MAG: hypothetical protein HY923_03100 [Elusimicrobia bacterium]|nr:hypothetical protein [Elusimicrobiota bacterium]